MICIQKAPSGRTSRSYGHTTKTCGMNSFRPSWRSEARGNQLQSAGGGDNSKGDHSMIRARFQRPHAALLLCILLALGAGEERTALDEYVAKPDPNYAFR